MSSRYVALDKTVEAERKFLTNTQSFTKRRRPGKCTKSLKR